MSRDPGDIPVAPGARNLVRALSDARYLPEEALVRALAQPDRIAPDVLAALERGSRGETLADPDWNLVFWGIHVLGAVGDQRLFGPLLRLLQQPDDLLEDRLEPALSRSVARLLAASFDGDEAVLLAALRNPATAEVSRWVLFGSLTILGIRGAIPRPRIEAFLRDFDETRPVRAGEAGWEGWASSVALLGFGDLWTRVEVAYGDARLLGDPEEQAGLEAILSEAVTKLDDPDRLQREGLTLPGRDPDTFLTEMEDVLSLDEGDEGEAEEPVRNPLKDVGRNDPCPCGSGRKFKKCCLAA